MEKLAKSPLALAQIFEPIREDLEKVDREFARHVQSQVELIPTIGKYIQTSGGKRVRPAVLLMAARIAGYTGDHAALYAKYLWGSRNGLPVALAAPSLYTLYQTPPRLAGSAPARSNAPARGRASGQLPKASSCMKSRAFDRCGSPFLMPPFSLKSGGSGPRRVRSGVSVGFDMRRV